MPLINIHFGEIVHAAWAVIENTLPYAAFGAAVRAAVGAADWLSGATEVDQHRKFIRPSQIINRMTRPGIIGLDPALARRTLETVH